MKRGTWVTGIALLLLAAMLPAGRTSTDSADVPWWEAGDYWQYAYNHTHWRTETTTQPSDGNGTSYTVWHNVSFTATETVVGNMTVTVHNETYDVVVVGSLLNGAASGVWGENITVSTLDAAEYDMGKGTLGLQYLRRSDHAVVKTETVQGSEVLSAWSPTPPFVRLDFPLSVGKTWTWTGLWTGIYLMPPPEQPPNVTIYYTCLHMTEVSTPAGTFDCYEVTVGKGSDGNNASLIYYTPVVGNVVKEVLHWGANGTGGTTTKELLSYSYRGRTNAQKEETPSFEMFLFLSAAATAVLLLRKKEARET
ncbi:MAG: hypothetical protein ACP5FL_04505 [Thermoplasmatota archaeon]